MSFSNSFGDAYLMGKLAFKIGQAFTKGKKSAPAEFREVESQLYSLSAALNAFSTARESASSAPLIVDESKLPKNVPSHFAENQDIILGMLRSCKETLSHLDCIVQKYSIIATSSDSSEPRLKRWSRELKSDWKKVAWTTEGGDLAALRSNLTIQTNSLNLILGVVINSQAERLQSDMDHISAMLGDIHEWYMENLKGKPATATLGVANAPAFGTMAGSVTVPEAEAQASPFAALFFELHQQSGPKSTLVCPRASLSQKITGAYYSSSLKSNQLFGCNCASGEDSHRSAVEAYGLSPLSFAARIAGSERAWLLYKVANRVTDQLTTLVVRGVPPEVMHDFEELLVHGLSVIQTRQMLRRSMSTMLAHASNNDKGPPRANILDLVSNATTLHRSVNTARFTSGSVTYSRDSVEFVQKLHYKSIDLDRILDEAVLPQSAFEEERKVEIVITYGKQEAKASADGIVRTILDLRWNSETLGRPTASATAALEFGSAEGAAQFHQEMEDIRMGLFVIHLEHPRDDEKTLIKLQAQDVHTERMHICDADIHILQNTTTQRLRLVVRSKNGFSVLSQELTRDFFQTLATRNRPDYGTLSYEVYMDASGKRIVKRCRHGFTHLVFSDSKIERVFAMGLAAVGGPSRQYLTEGTQPMEGVVEG
ncbi:hypothetical protein HRG_006448 [Hirsutella rhossiliensis]|uniref:Fungal N-terminal domain-containing protein n=1 Tax=Hirsutella rhossiliensis TaxID=111463 RepID=A0A9P8SIT5_9HYPO|nr:uncharacterized protein HRG_06448 [Hirsutella rhossiliensis]KAH0962346.1 hypothetical protein HRG_06448 [Hirsutella rhossiliensis]